MNNKKSIALAADHAGFDKKENIKYFLEKEGFNVYDFGTFSPESMDYPDVIHPLAKSVNEGSYQYGIIICGTGNGVAMVANKYSGVRAALCWMPEIALLARQHNNANVLSLPARFTDDDDALEIVRVFMNTRFEGGRHSRRVEKINKTM